MFKESAFIRKNTQELRKKLEELGYSSCVGSHGEGSIILATLVIKRFHGDRKGGRGYITTYSNEKDAENDSIKNGIIDCSDNEELFLAIAALRDDSDYMQWFVSNDGKWRLWIPIFIDTPAFYVLRSDVWHKASVTELIEHFHEKA